MKPPHTVFVGLSGGVDSAVAALRLQAQGYHVVGVFIKVWHPDFLTCNWEAERLDAMRVAAHLNIPFVTCDAEAAYRDEVAEYFISEYRAGRTPNPDVMCNTHVKFGAFLEFAKAQGADFIATGHYAQRLSGDEGVELHRGLDTEKDQTYFLWNLTNEQLTSAFFPIGDTQKSVIRAEAAAAQIPTAQKKDSQGICFLGQVNIVDFLSHYIDIEPGTVLNESGQPIGVHQGAFIYTLGQRHGFTLTTQNQNRQPMFVVSKDVDANTITVGPQRPTVATSQGLNLESLLLRHQFPVGCDLMAQTRYRQTPFKVTVSKQTATTLSLLPHTDVEKPAVGQSCVLYDGTHCIGGGIIAE